MKKLFTILLFALCLSARASTVITATVTVTNLPTNGFTISVNGSVRTWTNIVTSLNNQIANTNSLGLATTNLFYSYVQYPQANMNVSLSGVSSNTILFQAYPGDANTITFGSNWATVSYSTNVITTMQVFRGFASLVGNYELTNTANGIVSYLNSSAVTNAIATNAPAMANFVYSAQLNADIIGLSNLVMMLSTNSTNFVLSTSNSLYTNLYTSITNSTNGILDAAYHAASDFQPACANLSNWCQITTNSILSLLVGTSYLDGSGNVKLIDGNSILRYAAFKGGIIQEFFEDSVIMRATDSSHNFYQYDHGGTPRIEIDDASVDAGRTVFRTSSGHDDVLLDGANDQVRTYSFVSFNQQSLPAMAEGTITNFFADESNSSTTETTVDSYTLPGNILLTNGDTLHRIIGVKTAANGNSKTVKVYFDGNLAASATTSTSGAFVYVSVEVTRDSSTSYRSMASATTGSGTGGGTAGSAFAYVNEVSGEDWTTSKIFKVTLTGGASTDLTAVQDRIIFAPSSLSNY